MLTRNSIFHHFSMVNNNFWRDYREFRLEQGLLKFASQPLSASDNWNLVKFEEWIGKLIEGILLKLLILWVRKRLNFYYFFISCKTKTYNLIFILLKSSYFHRFLENPSPKKWRKKSKRPKFCDLEYAWAVESLFNTDTVESLYLWSAMNSHSPFPINVLLSAKYLLNLF